VQLDRAVLTSTDDAEEFLTSGTILVDSSDLELDTDMNAKDRQMIGIRFTNITIPRGAHINTARIQFTAESPGSRVTSVTLKAQAADNAGPFAAVGGNITARPATTASVAWPAIPAWTTDLSSAATATPDLQPLVQEIVDRAGWAPANALVFLLTGNGGERSAHSYDGRPAAAPKLHIEYVP
jgi:hypothetical protein